MNDNTHHALPGPFWRQWWSSVTSNLGDGITFVAMPLMAFALTSDERLLSLTAAATLLPWLILAIPIGVLVDRSDRRGLLISANLVRTAVFMVVSLAIWFDQISIWVLLVSVAVIGTCEVIVDSSAQAFLPSLVTVGELPRANGFLFAAEVVCGGMIGIALGAVLFQFEPGLPFAANSLAFFAAALLVWTIPASIRSTQSASQRLRIDMTTGLRALRDDQFLRVLAILLTVTNFGLLLGQGIFVKYAADELGLGGIGYGVLMVVAGLGASLGGLIGHRLWRRVGTLAAIAIPYLIFGLAQVVYAAFPITWVVGLTGFVGGAAVTIWNVVTVSLRQRIIPSDQFGRVNSVYRWLGTGAGALGAVVGGQIAFYGNLRTPYMVAAVLTLLALVIGVRPLAAGLRSHEADADPDPELQVVPATPAPPSMT
jgi:MFS family permease